MSLFEEFQEFRKILCVCSCCGKIKRISDLRLKVKGGKVRTWLDDFEEKIREIAKKEDKFEEEVGKLREKAREKGRKEAKKVFDKAISPSFKALKLNPHDIKPIMNPIDFVVFDGMSEKEEVNDIIMLSRKIKNKNINNLRKQVQQVIKSKDYEWQVARVNEEGKIELE